MREFAVDPSALLAAAGTLEGLAAQLDAEEGALRDAGTGARLAAGNELAAREVAGMASDWERVVRHLSAALTRDADALRLCARRYEQDDHDAAERLRRLGPGR
jgi:hypothetical protein